MLKSKSKRADLIFLPQPFIVLVPSHEPFVISCSLAHDASVTHAGYEVE
ncbi:hypothetical protein OIU74_017270 [Salix koriyanagi]|uniref:Uncharacterized protein n=1 Tax=Salix koriyanagi TaxID=2511006 RepID=A0A9Q0SST1_9ROSI|nr:hypothetical protein OIU74_017270 [Salix koriyanagi]